MNDDDLISRETYTCSVCGDTDCSNVDVVCNEMFDAYRWICSMCGNETNDQPPNWKGPSIPYKRGSSQSYRRMSHVVERFSAHINMDPRVPERDFKKIQNVYVTLLADGTIKNPIGKNEIRRILRFIDLRDKGERKFSNLYLERFKQIITRLGDSSLQNLACEKLARVGCLMKYWSHTWDHWQKDPVIQNRRFPERSHFPNFNQSFRRAFTLLGISETDVNFDEFPLPATAGSISRNTLYLDALENEAIKAGFLARG